VVAPFYWIEVLSDTVEELLRQEAELGISQLVDVELCSALSRRVRVGDIARDAAQAIANRFQVDRDHGFYIQLALEPIHYSMARDWIRRFDTPLRTLDALHLAVAVSNYSPLVTGWKVYDNSGKDYRLVAEGGPNQRERICDPETWEQFKRDSE